jgi:hypothetical protein
MRFGDEMMAVYERSRVITSQSLGECKKLKEYI